MKTLSIISILILGLYFYNQQTIELTNQINELQCNNDNLYQSKIHSDLKRGRLFHALIWQNDKSKKQELDSVMTLIGYDN